MIFIFFILFFVSNDIFCEENEDIIFDQGHELYHDSMPEGIKSRSFFEKIKQIYTKNSLDKKINQGGKKTYKTPPIIHVIRFGESLGELFLRWGQEWKNKHYKWEFVVWNRRMVEQYFPEGLFNQKIYDEALAMSDYAMMSKILRYEILYKFGGLFVDFHIKCFKHFDQLNTCYDFYVGLARPKTGKVVNNSVIGACPKHPVLKACLENIKKSDGLLPGDRFGIGNWMMRHFSSHPLTAAVGEKAGQDENSDIILPDTFFDFDDVIERFYHESSVCEDKVDWSSKKNIFCTRGRYKYEIKCWEYDHTFPVNDQTSIDFIKSSYPCEEKPLVIVIASYNNVRWLKRNLTSVFMQKYSNYRVIYVDDASPDGTGDLVEQFINEYGLKDKVTLIKNEERQGAAANFYKAAQLCCGEEIMVQFDGDDWFAHEHVFEVLNKVYHDSDVWMTYGQFLSYPDFKLSYCMQYPTEIIEQNNFRQHNWLVHHLRTSYVWLFNLVRLDSLQYHGKFLPMTWDAAEMFAMLEISGYRARFLPYFLYVHNQENPINDYKVDYILQSEMDKYIRRQMPYERLYERPCNI